MLVKEQKALAKLELAIIEYYRVMMGDDLVVDTTKTPEERMLFVATHINCLM